MSQDDLTSSPRDSLDLSPETMREFGYRTIDMVVEHLSRLGEGPAWTVLSRAEGEARLREPLPEEGAPLDALLPLLGEVVLSHHARLGHPRFFAFVPSAPTFPGVLGDLLAAGFNPFVGTWLGGSGPSMLELVVLEWFREMLGLPSGTGGLLTSGGSSATVMALAAARHATLDDRPEGAVIYASSETHSALDRAAWITGFPGNALCKLPVDEDFRLLAESLRSAVIRDRSRGLRPFLVVGNAGTTSTGSIDPLEEIAEIAGSERLWFHVDAAYGGFAAIVPRVRAALPGFDAADSWVLDPHKWLYQGIECGSVLLRRPGELRDAFHILPDYLQDIERGKEEPNFADLGLQLSRSARAFKVWLSIRHFGLRAFREAVERTLDLARAAETWLSADPGYELLSRAHLGIVTFRILPTSGSRVDPETLNREALERLNRSGYAFLSSTRLRGTYALRMCILSHRTQLSDIEGVLQRLAALAREVERERA